MQMRVAMHKQGSLERVGFIRGHCTSFELALRMVLNSLELITCVILTNHGPAFSSDCTTVENT